jgi:mannose-6-phosphate isomerase-like protein (cupin superfamily)
MIKQGDKIVNARTGQVMFFLKTGAETNGTLLQIDCISPPSTFKEPEHIHPFQENKFEITSGYCNFSVDGKEQVVGPGQFISIPPNVRHHFWNARDIDTHYIQEFRPALDIAGFFETFFALSRDGKLNGNGIPNLFLGSLTMLKYKNEIRVTTPPWAIQYLTYIILAPLGKLMGFQADYKSKN